MVPSIWDIPGIQARPLADFLEQSLSAIGLYDDRGQPLYISEKLGQLLPDRAKGTSFFETFASPCRSRESLTHLWQRALQGETVHLTTSHDDQRVLQCSLKFGAEARLMGVRVELEDAAARLQSQYERAIAALQHTEAKWQAMIQPHLWMQVSTTGQIISVSSALEQILGYQAEALLGCPLVDLLHPHDRRDFALAYQAWKADSSTNLAHESWWQTQAGEWRCLHLQGYRFPPALGIEGLIISGYDLTDRRRLQAELQASEAKFNALVSNIPGAVFRCDASYRMLYISDGIRALTGYAAPTLLQNQQCSYLSLIHPDDVTILTDSLVRSTLGYCRSQIDYRLIQANGRIRWVSERKQGIFDRQGRLLGFDGVLLERVPAQQTSRVKLRPAIVGRSNVAQVRDLGLGIK